MRPIKGPTDVGPYCLHMTRLLIVLALLAPIDPASLTRYEARRLSMACVYDIAAYGDASSDVPAVLEKALDEVDRIDRLMSHYKPQSPLSQLNRDAAAGAGRRSIRSFSISSRDRSTTAATRTAPSTSPSVR